MSDDIQKIESVSGGQIAQNIYGDQIQNNNYNVNNHYVIANNEKEKKKYILTIENGETRKSFRDKVEEYVVFHSREEDFEIINNKDDYLKYANIKAKELYKNTSLRETSINLAIFHQEFKKLAEWQTYLTYKAVEKAKNDFLELQVLPTIEMFNPKRNNFLTKEKLDTLAKNTSILKEALGQAEDTKFDI